MFEVKTYGELLSALQKLTPKQLLQKVQITQAGNCDDSVPVVLQPAVAVGTVRELYETDGQGGVIERQIVRDSSNGRHNSDSVVITTDVSGFEDDTVYGERYLLLKVVQFFAEGKHGLKPYALARGILEKIKENAEKNKVRMLKECA